MVVRCEADIVEVTPEISFEIDSNFTKEQLSLIKDELLIIKKKSFLHEQVHVGGEILGEILGKEDFRKVLLLSEYVDQIVSKLQKKQLFKTKKKRAE